MRPNPQEPADLVAFTEEIVNGKLYFLCSVEAVPWITRAVLSPLKRKKKTEMEKERRTRMNERFQSRRWR